MTGRDDNHYRCLGVGVGPANLSLACLLHGHADVPSLFLDKKPPKDLKTKAEGVSGEKFQAAAKEIFIHYPDGLGTTKLKMDVGPGTTRNMNTVEKLAGMAAEL